MVAPQVKVAGSWIIPKSAWTKVSGQWKSWFLQGGILDTGFNSASGPNNVVRGIEAQSDGKIIIVGPFATYNGSTVNRIARLNANGTLDTAFAANTGSGISGGYATPQKIAVQSDGKILVVGYYTSFNGTAVGGVARLNADGTLDTAFATNTGSGSGSIFYGFNDVELQPDGKIVLVGDFISFNGTSIKNIVRLNSNGTLDSGFATNIGSGPDSSLEKVKVQSDGKLVLIGGFTTYNGYTLGAIARLNTDGTLDTAFAANTGVGTGDGGAISILEIQSDDKIIIGGGFSTFNGVGNKGILRLNTDGTLDSAFYTSLGAGYSQVNSAALDKNQKVIIGMANSPRLARANQDGTPDSNFATNVGTSIDTTIFGLQFANQLDGKIVIAGNFTQYNGVTAIRVARIGGDAAL
jgi:uncharacterized delta-60 repeat protein